MLFLLGILIVAGSVFYGFVMSDGRLLALWQPFEILIIIGGAGGAFLIANPWRVIKATGRMIPQVIVGKQPDRKLQIDVLSLLADILLKARREGIMSIEKDMDKPGESALFARYPAVIKRHELSLFIADYFRIIAAGNLTAFELEAMMEQEIEARLYELQRPGVSLGRVADALPGFGIVAAVLGIVITMGAIDNEMTQVGSHVAAALVGTFSGVLLAYGLVGPLASVLRHQAEEEIRLYEAVRACIVASLNGMAPQLAVEFGRKSLFTHRRPDFSELENKLRGR